MIVPEPKYESLGEALIKELEDIDADPLGLADDAALLD